MEIKYLCEFVALAETGNFLETASNLFISQSCLSKHIMAIENELEISLFDRTTRRVRLSQDGELFLPYAIKIVQLHHEYTNVLNARIKATTNKITIASTSQVVQYSVTDALAQYKRQHLSCSLDVLVEPHKNLKKLLYQHKADFIWIGETSDESCECEFERVPFFSEPLVVLFPNRHPLASFSTIPIDKLRGEELVMQDNSSVEQEVFVNLCLKHGFEPKIISVPGGKVMVDFVRQGLGAAVMLKTPAQNMSCPDVSLTAIESSPIINVNLLYLKGRKLSPVAKDFLEFLKTWQ